MFIEKSELILNLECENVPTRILFCYNKINNFTSISVPTSYFAQHFLPDFFHFVTPNLTLRSWDNHQFKRKSE
jgi:hypothetical protein